MGEPEIGPEDKHLVELFASIAGLFGRSLSHRLIIAGGTASGCRFSGRAAQPAVLLPFAENAHKAKWRLDPGTTRNRQTRAVRRGQ